LNPSDYLPLAAKHSLRTILDGLLVVVQASSKKLHSVFGPDVSRHPGYREALIEASIITNAALGAHSIQQEFGSENKLGLRAVYGVYLLETREVWTAGLGTINGNGLAAAPQDVSGFVELGDAIVRSTRITSLIKTRE